MPSTISAVICTHPFRNDRVEAPDSMTIFLQNIIKKTLHSLPVRARYGVSLVSSWCDLYPALVITSIWHHVIIDPVIRMFHCVLMLSDTRFYKRFCRILFIIHFSTSPMTYAKLWWDQFEQVLFDHNLVILSDFFNIYFTSIAYYFCPLHVEVIVNTVVIIASMTWTAQQLMPWFLVWLATSVLRMNGKQIPDFHKEKFQLHIPSRFWKVIENTKTFLFPKINSAWQGLRIKTLKTSAKLCFSFCQQSASQKTILVQCYCSGAWITM